MCDMQQKKFIEKILKLKNKNPDMEIKFCVDSGSISEYGAWTAHTITDVQIIEWYTDGERIYTDEDDIFTHFFEDVVSDKLSDEEATEEAIKLTKEKMKRVIAVYTNATDEV